MGDERCRKDLNDRCTTLPGCNHVVTWQLMFCRSQSMLYHFPTTCLIFCTFHQFIFLPVHLSYVCVWSCWVLCLIRKQPRCEYVSQSVVCGVPTVCPDLSKCSMTESSHCVCECMREGETISATCWLKQCVLKCVMHCSFVKDTSQAISATNMAPCVPGQPEWNWSLFCTHPNTDKQACQHTYSFSCKTLRYRSSLKTINLFFSRFGYTVINEICSPCLSCHVVEVVSPVE